MPTLFGALQRKQTTEPEDTNIHDLSVSSIVRRAKTDGDELGIDRSADVVQTPYLGCTLEGLI